MTFRFRLVFMILCSFSLVSCNQSKKKAKEQTQGNAKIIKDTITYRAEVWAEKEDVKRLGGKAKFKQGLTGVFENTTNFFNSADNKFEYYFKFVPADLVVYDNEGDQNNYRKNIAKAEEKLDTNQFDYQVFFALDAKEKGSWAGGGKVGQTVVAIFRTLKEQSEIGNIFEQEPPQRGVYSDLAHEYGHMRGATDLYQYLIKAEDNPVNHQVYEGPKTIMVSSTDYKSWSDYESYLFNYTAKQKQLEPNLNRKIFPDTLQIKVFKDDKPVSNITVKLYGTRAGGAKNNRDVYPKPYREFTTDNTGVINITDVYKLYHPSTNDPRVPPLDAFPYHYWFSFVIEAEYQGKKEYAWVPDWKTQITKLKGEDKHEVDIRFED